MKSYRIELIGQTPLIQHNDNIAFTESISRWCKDPDNAKLSVAGDDRSPAWRWIGCLYHDGKHVGIDNDNIMTMMREGGARVPLKGKETYKKQTQSGIALSGMQFQLFCDGREIKIDPIRKLIGNNDFCEHMDLAEKLGFELFMKRARVGSAKHVRIRPMFRNWTAIGELDVIDEDISGITKSVLQKILNVAGSQVGLCDWRPSSGKSGCYGKFTSTVTEI